MLGESITYFRTACTPYAVKDDSLARQEDICRAYIQEHGLVEVESFYDRGVSGNAKDRKGFNSLLEFLEKRKGNTISIIVTDPSRIGRSAEVAGELMEQIIALGGKVLFADVSVEASAFLAASLQIKALAERS